MGSKEEVLAALTPLVRHILASTNERFCGMNGTFLQTLLTEAKRSLMSGPIALYSAFSDSIVLSRPSSSSSDVSSAQRLTADKETCRKYI